MTPAAANEPLSIYQQIASVTEIVKECLRSGEIEPYFAALRDSDLPLIPLRQGSDLAAAHRQCTHVLHGIAMHSVGAAYALENHYFVLGAARMYQEFFQSADFDRFLTRVRESRLLVANTRAAIHTSMAFSEGAKATADGTGYRVNGEAGFVSLARFADILWLQMEYKAGNAVFLVSLQDCDSVEFGDLSFANVMRESETRSLTFHATRIEPEDRLPVPEADLGPQGRLVAALEFWHDSLIAAQFLGAAAGALEEVNAFTKQMKSWSGKPLAQLDNVLSETGRLGIRYAAAAAMVQQVAELLAERTGSGDPESRVQRALFAAKAVNWQVTNLAEEIIGGCRRLIGTRAFRGDNRVERLSTEVMIGPLVPRGNPLLEMEYGRYLLEHFAPEPGRSLSLVS